MRRQLIAIWLSGDRTAALAKLSLPTLVIHGDADPLIPVDGGRATARAIPGARLMMVDGMGHDLPRALWPVLIDAIAAHALAADGAAATSSAAASNSAAAPDAAGASATAARASA